MAKAEPREKARLSGHDDATDDEIEILEIVGLDEDSPPVGLTPVEDPESEDETEEYVLDLDREELLAPEPPPPVAAPAGGYDREAPLRDSLVRLQADFDNYKKRVDRERGDFQKHASSGLVRRLLPVLDNFERAVSAPLPSDGTDALRDGLILIFKQMLHELRKEGLVAVDSVGQTFDPNVHEAVATDEQSDLPSNTVVEELQRGYLLHGRLLRPALVKVSTGSGGGHRPEDR